MKFNIPKCALDPLVYEYERIKFEKYPQSIITSKIGR